MRNRRAGKQTAPAAVIGVPGGGLGNGKGGAAEWAANAGVARAGKDGEKRTAQVTDPIARRHGCVVLHDLDMPGSNRKANIDHVVVSGSDILILDSKNWRPGFYWTFAGRTRRGVKTFKWADKQTMDMAAKSLRRYLDSEGITGYRIAGSVVIVWPSSKKGKVSLWAARFPFARLMTGEKFERKARRLCGTAPADQRIVEALRRFVVAERSRPAPDRQQNRTNTEPAPVAFRKVGGDPYSADSYTNSASQPGADNHLPPLPEPGVDAAAPVDKPTPLPRQEPALAAADDLDAFGEF